MTLLEKLAARIDPVDAAWYDLNDVVAERVAVLLDKRGWTQRDLVNALAELGSKKKDSYISRLLSGGQNVTLRTLAELEVALGEPIITTPEQVQRDIEDAQEETEETHATAA